MKYTKENITGMTPEYVSACRSLDMYIRKKFKCPSCNRGAISETRQTFWFQPPPIEGYVRGSWVWAGTHGDKAFGISFHYYDYNQRVAFTLVIEAKIPCDKLAWKVREERDE